MTYQQHLETITRIGREYRYCKSIESLFELDPVERGVVRTFLQRRRVAVRTPEDLQRQYSLVKTRCMQKWKEARAAKDYAIFMPWLQQAFDLKGQIARAINPDAPAFDTLVSLTDAGADVGEISRQFAVLQKGLGALLKKLERGTAPAAADYPTSDPAAMSAFAQSCAREAGFTEDLGSFNDQVVHGFTSFMGPPGRPCLHLPQRQP